MLADVDRLAGATAGFLLVAVIFGFAVSAERGFSKEELAASFGSKFPALPLRAGWKPGFSCDQGLDESWECSAFFRLEDSLTSDGETYKMNVSEEGCWSARLTGSDGSNRGLVPKTLEGCVGG